MQQCHCTPTDTRSRDVLFPFSIRRTNVIVSFISGSDRTNTREHVRCLLSACPS